VCRFTAKLSRKFYEKLGDDVANELVEWFNVVDATYRSDLRELNDLNFARFDAKLDQRSGELRAEMQAGFARADAKLEQRVAELRAEMQARIAELKSEMQAGFARVDQRFAELETRLTKRLFAFWVAQAATTAGLVLGVVQLLGK
jgi:hypothetical protein